MYEVKIHNNVESLSIIVDFYFPFVDKFLNILIHSISIKN